MNKYNYQDDAPDAHTASGQPIELRRKTAPEMAQISSVSTKPTLPDAIEKYPHLANLNNYVVVLSSGAEDGGKRATLAFSAACTAQAMELDTQLFLVGDGSHWAYQGSCDGITQKGFPALTSLVESFVELEGKIFVCSACDTVCAMPVDSEGKILRRQPFIQPRGLASILEHMVGGSSITF
jgi:predicted peroxiredoxin